MERRKETHEERKGVEKKKTSTRKKRKIHK